jgi:hypothetical protein
MTAELAAVGRSLAFDPRQQGGVEGVAMSAVPALAGAHAFPGVGRGFLHALGSNRLCARFFLTWAAGKTCPFMAI